MKYSVTYTDTFGGEANYSWARRAIINAPADAKTKTLVRLAKKSLGLTGRHKTEAIGDVVSIRPAGCCTIAFIEPLDEEDEFRSQGRTGL